MSRAPAAVASQQRQRLQTGAQEPRRERLEARVSAEQKRLFQYAADVRGLTLTDFVLSSVQAAATRAIQEHDVLTLSARDRELFVQTLLNPPAPNDRLLAAARRYREMFGD